MIVENQYLEDIQKIWEENIIADILQKKVIKCF